MTRKTVKLKKEEYFELKEIENKPYFLIGGRGTGKSYTVKHFVKDMLIDSGFEKRFMYVRVSPQEIKTVDSWLQTTQLTKHVDDMYALEHPSRIQRGKPYAGAVSITYRSGNRVEYVHVGYTTSLGTSALEKSADYPDVGCIIFEEFIRLDLAMSPEMIQQYCFNFLELIETITRERKIPIFMIANNLAAYNPLLHAFKDAILIKIFTEPRREIYSEGLFHDYLSGERYTLIKPKAEDFEPMFKFTVKGKRLVMCVDKYRGRDYYITDKRTTQEYNEKAMWNSEPCLVYEFEKQHFHFNSPFTETHFYNNIPEVKQRIRAKYVC